MNKQTILTVGKSILIILILLAVVFALRAPAADLPSMDNELKAQYVDSSGLPYFSEMDSYYNLRLTQDYADHGFVGDEIINGSEWDMHRYAPDGNQINYELGIVYLTNWLHDVANSFFGGNYSIKEVAFWAGPIISSLAVIPAFIFARRISNDWGAIVATLIIVLAPNYFSHTFAGFFDTDMFYYIFSLLFVFFFVECIRTDNIILKIIYAVISIVSIGLFSQSWTGYIFYVGLMGIFSIVYLIVCFIFDVDNNKSEYSSKVSWFIHQDVLLSLVILGVIGFAGLAVFKGVDGVLGIFGNLTGLLSLQSASRVVGGFPNVLVSVAEMQQPAMLGAGMNSMFLASTNGFINGIGGIAVFFAALIVAYILVSRSWKFRSAGKTVQVSGKPQKGERVSAAEKLDDDRKFKFSFTDLKFGGSNEILASKKLTVLYATLFVVWIAVTALAVTRGSRFITTIVLPFGLLAGVFVSYASDYIKTRLNNDKWLVVIVAFCGFLAAVPLATINTMYGIAIFAVIFAIGLVAIYGMKPNASVKVPLKKYVVIAAIIIALVTPTLCGAFQVSTNVYPGTSDPMWNSMEWIKETQSNDTVITSWWDFGYLFEIAADRQATFDGGSQTGSRAFWLGQAMGTDNLDLSVGIFRMLDTTGERATQKLVDITGDSGQSVGILLDILPKSSSDAQKTLMDKYHLNSTAASDIVNLTHPANPRPVIFVASSDMLSKAGWWSYFGHWNFENQTSENYNYLVPTSTIQVAPGQTANYTLMQDSGMTVNTVIERGTGNNTTTAHVQSVYTDNGQKIMINDTEYNPYNASNIIVIENNQIMKNESIKGAENGNFTIFLVGNDNEYTPFLISNELVNSMFTRLYLMGGAGQNQFTLVHSEPGVMLFKVNFDGSSSNSTASGNSTSSN